MNEHDTENDERDADGDEPLFTIELLVEELQHPDTDRRDAAVDALLPLKRLVDLRAALNCTTADQVWEHIFDRDRLQAEIDGSNPVLRDAAVDVLDAVTHCAALRYAEDSTLPPSLEDQLWSMEVGAKIRHRLDEMRRALGYACERVEN